MTSEEPVQAEPGPAPGAQADLDRLVHAACTSAWSQLLCTDTSKPQHLLKAALLVPCVLHELEGRLCTGGLGKHPPTKPTFSYLCSLLEASSDEAAAGGVTLTQFEAAILNVTKEVVKQWLMLASYEAWTWRLATALVLLCCTAMLLPGAAVITVLPGLVLGPALGILVVLGMDETTKLSKQWVRQKSSLGLSSASTQGSQLHGTLEVANQLRELLSQPADELDELQAARVYMQATGNELCQAINLEYEDAQQAQQEQTIARSPARAAPPAPRHIAVMNTLHMAQTDTASEFVASKVSMLNKAASANAAARNVDNWMHGADHPGVNSSASYASMMLGSNSQTMSSAFCNPRASATSQTFRSFDMGSAASQADLEHSNLGSARSSNTSVSILKTRSSLLRTLFSMKERQSKGLKPHKLNRSAQKAVAQAQAQAQEEAAKVLGWKAKTSTQKTQAGKVISRPGVPGLYFQEMRPPEGEEGADSSSEDEAGDPRLSFDRLSCGDSLSLEMPCPGSRFSPHKKPMPGPGQGPGGPGGGRLAPLGMVKSGPAACGSAHMAIGNRGSSISPSSSHVGNMVGQSWRPSESASSNPSSDHVRPSGSKASTSSRARSSTEPPASVGSAVDTRSSAHKVGKKLEKAAKKLTDKLSRLVGQKSAS